MTQIPIQKETIDRIASANKIKNPGKASIREMRKMIQDVEAIRLYSANMLRNTEHCSS